MCEVLNGLDTSRGSAHFVREAGRSTGGSPFARTALIALQFAFIRTIAKGTRGESVGIALVAGAAALGVVDTESILAGTMRRGADC